MNNKGMTLLEVMMATALLTIVMGTLFSISLSFSDTAEVQESKIQTNDESRRALLQIIPELRQAAKGSITIGALSATGDSISYRVATDVDGNGTAVDVNGDLELSDIRTIQRDEQDLNGDGQASNQLIRISGDAVTVLANQISDGTETFDENGVFGPAQDTNGNGRMDRGFFVEFSGSGLMVNVQTQKSTRRGHTLTTTLSEFVKPRN